MKRATLALVLAAVLGGGCQLPQLNQQQIDSLSIKTQGPDQPIKFLSGGNQQKVILSRWIVGNFQLGVFDDPTKGIDIKAKEDIYELMNELTKEGKSVILLSSYLPELINNCDRILVMFHGEILGELPPDRSRLEELGLLMAGNTEQPALAS